MNYAEMSEKYKYTRIDALSYAYYNFMKDLVGKEKAQQYIESAIVEIEDYHYANSVMDKLMNVNYGKNKQTYLSQNEVDAILSTIK